MEKPLKKAATLKETSNNKVREQVNRQKQEAPNENTHMYTEVMGGGWAHEC